jgi:putative ABC transport system substrate-binding protein
MTSERFCASREMVPGAARDWRTLFPFSGGGRWSMTRPHLTIATALIVLAFVLLIGLPIADAQAPGRVWRVAVLTGAVPREGPLPRALEQRLTELGYVEGKNLLIDFRTAGGQLDRLPTLAAELVGRGPDVVVAVSTQAGIALKNATRRIPIVLAAVGDPVATGIVPSLARPGGNITGVSLLNAELSGKALQLLRESVPGASRVGVFWNSENPLHRQVRAATEAAAAGTKVTLQLLDVRSPDDLPKAFDALARNRAEALLVFPDAVTLAHRTPIVAHAAERRLPAMYPFREMVDEGGLMCYGPSLAESGRAATDYVDKILKGATPGTLPIAQATRFDLLINLKTAKALGLTIPPAVLARADELRQ